MPWRKAQLAHLMDTFPDVKSFAASWICSAGMPVIPETSLEDDWPMGTPSHTEQAQTKNEPEQEESEEDARARVENRRRMLQEKLEQIRKKNQATQFDDLSDLDDEGVFFNKK